MAIVSGKHMTYAEYLAFEEASPEKHEFVQGEPYAYGPDLRICFSDLAESAYADAVVVCGPIATAADDPNAATNPTVVCEVLSPSTEAYDRGRKFEKYRGLPSVKEYVLVAQERALVEVFRRESDESWTLRTYGPGARVELASVDVRFAVDELYAGIFETDVEAEAEAKSAAD